jgi:hypothetical protein
MTRKTESLSYPVSPLAAMRELQELDAVANGKPKTDVPQKPEPVTLPVALATRSAVGNATGSEEGSATRPRRRLQTSVAESNSVESEPQVKGNPLIQAMREMLGKPYTLDPKGGPYTVSTVKIPTEVWERLGWAASLTERPKQEIIAEALKEYFAKILRNG